MPDPTCSLCTDKPLATDAERRMEACSSCAARIGIIPMPPARRPPAPCARCNGQQFMRVIPREYTTDRAGDGNVQISAPMYLTYTPARRLGWLFKSVIAIEVENPGHGLLETYVCRTCGAVEWYCADAENIPAHPHLMSELIDYAGDSPYR